MTRPPRSRSLQAAKARKRRHEDRALAARAEEMSGAVSDGHIGPAGPCFEQLAAGVCPSCGWRKD